MKVRSYYLNALLAALYSVVYIRCYVSFLNYYFEYSGFALYPREPSFLVLSVAIAIVPVFAYRGMRALSSAISVFVFVLLYIPIILTFALGSTRPVEHIVVVQLAFMGGMFLLFAADVPIIRNPIDLRTKYNLARPLFTMTVFAIAYMLIVYRGNLSFASLDEVYDHRFANANLAGNVVTRYLSSWLLTVLIPLCLAYGLVTAKYRYFVAGTVACVVLYMANATKIAIILPGVYLGVFALFSGNRVRALYPLFTGSLIVVLATLLLVTETGGIAFAISSVLINRTIGSGGEVTVDYYEFFSFYPQTSFTHVNGIRQLLGTYPYGERGLGQVIGQFYWSPDMNANANFWATDGIAAMGLGGIPVASVACALMFVAMNTITRTHSRLFVVLVFLPFVTQLLNTSLFSSLWSGGGFFLLLYFMLSPGDERTAKGGTAPAPALSPAPT